MRFNKNIGDLSAPGWYWAENKWMLSSTMLVGLVAFAVFKSTYPYPTFSQESIWFVEAAILRTSIDVLPIGYSIFLRIIGSFSHSHLLITLIQFLALQVATAWLGFTLCYLLDMRRLVKAFVVSQLLFIPLFIYTSNFITNQALFAAGSICWITSLLRILYNPTRVILFSHGLLLTILLAFNNAAMYFPFISLIVVILGHLRSKTKWLTILLLILPPAIFIGYTQYQFSRKTGIPQFSPLKGWQLAGNALTAYTKVPIEKRVAMDIRYNSLENMVNPIVDSIRLDPQWPFDDLTQYYVWQQQSPLHAISRSENKKNIDRFTYWALYGKIYKEFGQHLIEQYPGAYLKYFIIPNLLNYVIPKTDLPGMYNPGLMNMRLQEADKGFFSWFNMQESQFTFDFTLDSWMGYYSVLFSMINLLLVLTLLLIVATGALRNQGSLTKKVFAVLIVVLIFNIAFNVSAAPIVLRNQIAPLVIMLMFCIISVSLFIKNSSFSKTSAISCDALETKQ